MNTSDTPSPTGPRWRTWLGPMALILLLGVGAAFLAGCKHHRHHGYRRHRYHHPRYRQDCPPQVIVLDDDDDWDDDWEDRRKHRRHHRGRRPGRRRHRD